MIWIGLRVSNEAGSLLAVNCELEFNQPRSRGEWALSIHRSKTSNIMNTPDPWSRPSVQDLREVLESIEHVDGSNLRTHERIDLTVPAEVTTSRGNTVPAMTREISRFGIGLLHRGSMSLGEVTVKMASESREYCYRVALEWCMPCENGMFMSGGRFLTKPNTRETSDD